MKSNLGAFITILAGILWGFSGTCSQYIFERFPIEPAHLTAIRILSAGIILLCIGFITSKKDMLKIRESKQDMTRVIIFGIFGVMFSSLTYMTAISYTNSGTATILQYTGPVLVMIISCFMTRKLPTFKEVLAVILALAGTFFIATHGDISTMVINTPGLIWGLLAAVALALYTLIPGSLAEKYGSIPITSYGMISGGVTLFILSGAWNAEISIDYRFFLAFIAIVICGTVLTYSLYLKGLTMIGPVKASMIASVEPVAAAVFMVVWLNAPFHYMDFIGFTCILATVFLLIKKE
ncbi:MAG: EamA family transporter [Firmicutes bacterium]|nr:EamA family transporter [Bacillota bacterium]